MKLLRITDSEINENGQLVVKAIGAKSTYTAEEYAPHGTDARPPKNTTALFSTTEAQGDEAMVGFLIVGRKAEIGEHRIFSTDANRNFKFNVWLRADGTCLIGDSDNPSEYTEFATLANELKTKLEEIKTSINNNATIYNAHTHLDPVSGSTGPPSALQSQNTSTFASIVNEKVKFK